MADDKLDSVINASTATLVGIILLASVVIPVGVAQISALTGESEQFIPILYAVITMACIGLIIGIIRYFGKSKE